jgi:transcriptional regulator with XRE-family HTH domain
MSDATAARLVGRRISAARQAAQLTQAQLAARVGWPRDTLMHYEYGRRALSVDRLATIAAALGLHPAALIIGDDEVATLVNRLLADATLRSQVAFFITTLDDQS